MSPDGLTSAIVELVDALDVGGAVFVEAPVVADVVDDWLLEGPSADNDASVGDVVDPAVVDAALQALSEPTTRAATARMWRVTERTYEPLSKSAVWAK